jgi:hypothetical protein
MLEKVRLGFVARAVAAGVAAVWMGILIQNGALATELRLRWSQLGTPRPDAADVRLTRVLGPKRIPGMLERAGF